MCPHAGHDNGDLAHDDGDLLRHGGARNRWQARVSEPTSSSGVVLGCDRPIIELLFGPGVLSRDVYARHREESMKTSTIVSGVSGHGGAAILAVAIEVANQQELAAMGDTSCISSEVGRGRSVR